MKGPTFFSEQDPAESKSGPDCQICYADVKEKEEGEEEEKEDKAKEEEEEVIIYQLLNIFTELFCSSFHSVSFTLLRDSCKFRFTVFSVMYCMMSCLRLSKKKDEQKEKEEV